MRDLEKMRPHHPVHNRRWLFPVVAILIALTAVTLAAWYLLFNDRDTGSSTTSISTTTLAGSSEQSSAAAQIRAVVIGMGLTGVTVEERTGTIYLTGSVNSEADRTAAIGAAKALAGTTPIDAGGLSVAVLDDDLRAAALASISAAGFDRVNVSVSGGVATLTGVTPEAGSAELIAAVKAVDGISQVVDMTETADRAAALATELNRVTAVTPIIFESGQISLNALQKRILDSAAEIMLAYDGPIVTVVGYTDAAGTTEENQRISLQRAEEVRDYLIGQGVPAERLDVDARGEAGSTGSESVAGLERRVEFEVGYAVPSGGNAAFRIGIVAPSAADDLAFTQSIVDAADVIAAERGDVGVDISDGLFVTEDAEAAIRSYAAAGYDLVIAHGSQYGPSLASIAPEFPNVAFAWGTAADTFDLPNVSAYEVAADQGGYVMGTVAAQLTESNVIGIVGPLEVGDAALYINGFTAGVNATDPNVAVLTDYIGSFSDLGLAAEAASADVEAGADVLTGSAQMVVGAVGVAAENNAVWFGNQANQSELAPSLVVASQVYHWEVALRQIIGGLDQGVLGGETYTLTLANGGIVIEYNPGYDLAPGIKEAADAVTAGIIEGSVTTGQ
jgi:basic membrane protein A